MKMTGISQEPHQKLVGLSQIHEVWNFDYFLEANSVNYNLDYKFLYFDYKL